MTIVRQVRIQILSIVSLGIMFIACTNQPAEEILVYENDFERDLINAFQRTDTSFVSFDQSSEQYFEFNGSRNLGRFSTGGLTLNLIGLPKHQWLRISFEFYVHDNWEGNGLRGNGEDVVILNIDDLNVHFSSIINTKCLTRDCEAIQSFPDRIKSSENPENSGVSDPSLLGVCKFKNEIGGSKLIKFADLYPHSSANLRVNIAAGIKDAGFDLCMKSWSIDNLKIIAVSLPE